MEDVVILSAVRTPIGAFQGALATLPAHALGARALAAAISRAGVTPEAIEQVNMGCVLTAGQGQAPARQAALGAGCPVATGAITLNKVCGSGMRAAMIAANDLRCGDYRLVAAGGMESMSQAPYLAAGVREGLRLGHGKLLDSTIHDGLWDPYNDIHMGSCAEICAAEYKLTREEQDAFSLESYRRARAAGEDGSFAAEIVSVAVPQKGQKKGQPAEVERDEEPWKVDLDRMTSLRPAFQKDGTVTAGNASKINDGAAALVLTTAAHAAAIGARPLARILAHSSLAQKPEWFTTAPVGAARTVLARAGLEAADIDLWEVNEAFAVVALAFIRELGLPPERVNVHGGAVALGHPIGASGARILVTLLHALRAGGGRLGCAAICIGGGEATAMVIERLD
ncbi:MAG TPA: acetyl-CoA C-acyltransferase [Thermoanaerobaculia bacterium]|jgi:acetyl-CoA C-acetyltransferase|nr:acetyl-CoA C-acyltransferase [Thermoanaerobaculia bacterium]